ncbi:MULTISPECIES: division/cell wall cluster transcriptional repressor MraZ [unclassified Rhodococcus (in: high G+C Gram-positive bacteria)]|uniref:division/cell wall cluster transcriptional repressor MraZ n=1 Tax=unclassified Rhodococcus (in: high G+C Gram-positive bacteria) TaxID=192944 RepID=UPI0006F94214|nr:MULTISPECIES: division/cell wall cluster transcriptional repressor MraZ [unclassified Rhodococcus (in: high G+C Gram-positive bacteria)]KQU30563.1 division/cell wall cluster transcriptional repressor MraZ [Rhodococcus sp. Leaf225]KQU44534.1 division/cell wall cluster transcriptional repressor MraZ [Rhodococcus sp. Leaf258]
MFLGTYTPKLDDKFRLTLPAKFREDLAGGVMVSKGQDHSLAIYPRDVFAERVAKLSKASRSNPQARAYIRNLAAGTDEQRPDSQGRITIGSSHREYAALSKDCVVIGSMDHLELWDAASWERYSQEHEEDFSQAVDESLIDML